MGRPKRNKILGKTPVVGLGLRWVARGETNVKQVASGRRRRVCACVCACVWSQRRPSHSWLQLAWLLAAGRWPLQRPQPSLSRRCDGCHSGPAAVMIGPNRIGPALRGPWPAAWPGQSRSLAEQPACTAHLAENKLGRCRFFRPQDSNSGSKHTPELEFVPDFLAP